MRNLITKIVKWLKADRSLHLMVSTALVILFFGIFGNLPIAFGIAIAIGIAKEFIYDKWMKKGSFEIQDIVADLIGTFIGIAYCTWIMLMV